MIHLRVKTFNLCHKILRLSSFRDLSSVVRATAFPRNLNGPPAVTIPGTAGVALDGKGSVAASCAHACSSNLEQSHNLLGKFPETHTYILHKVHFSTTSCRGGSEEDRVTRAYLGENLARTVQKHDGNRLVYEVRGQAMLRIVTLTFYTTAAFGIYLAPDFISSALENEVLNQEAVLNLTAVFFAVIGLPASLRLLSKRLILKLYHNEARETYIAITQSLLMTNKATKFSIDDVVRNEKKSLLSKLFNLTSFKAKQQPYHVNSYNFKLPSDYNHLFGFDR